MDQARILVATSQPILESIVMTALANLPDVEVVGQLRDEAGLNLQLAQREADIVIIDVGSGNPATVGFRLLEKYPELRVLTIAGDGRDARMYELRPHAVELGEISPEGLREAIRNVLRHAVT